MSTKAELRHRIDELERLNQLQATAIRNARIERDDAHRIRAHAQEELLKLRLLIRALLPLTGIAEWADKDTSDRNTNPWYEDSGEDSDD